MLCENQSRTESQKVSILVKHTCQTDYQPVSIKNDQEIQTFYINKNMKKMNLQTKNAKCINVNLHKTFQIAIYNRVSFFCRLNECQSRTYTPQHNPTTTITKPTAQNLTGPKEKQRGEKKRGRNSPKKQLVFWVLRHVHKISEGKNTQTYSNINIRTTSHCVLQR